MIRILFLLSVIALTFGACKSTKDAVDENATATEVSTRKATPRGQRGAGQRAQRGGDRSEFFARLDTNGDGKIAKDEMRGPMAERFDLIDLDKDGFISKEEMEKAPRPQREGRRKQQF